MHRLAKIHTLEVTDDDRRTQHCTTSATVSKKNHVTRKRFPKRRWTASFHTYAVG